MSEDAVGKEPDSPGVSPHDDDAKALSRIHPERRATSDSAADVSSNTLLDDDLDDIAAMEAALEAAEAKKAKRESTKTQPSTLLGSVPPPTTTAPFTFSKPAAAKPATAPAKPLVQTKEAEAEQAHRKAAADARMREANMQSARSMQHERARTQQREAAATKILESKEKTATTARLLQKEQEKKLRETFKSKTTKKKKPTKHRNNSRFDDEAEVDNDSDIEDDGDGEEPDTFIVCDDEEDDGDRATQKKKKQTDKPKNQGPEAAGEKGSSSSVTVDHEVVDDDDDDEDEAVVTKVNTPKAKKTENQERKYPLPADDDDALEQKQQRVDDQKAAKLKTQISLQDAEVLRIQAESEAVAQRLAGAVRKRKMLEDQMSMLASGGKEFVVDEKAKKKSFEGVPELFALERMFTAFEKETPYDEDDTEEYELREMVKNVIRNSCEAITETDSACRDLGRKRQRKDPEVVWQLKYTALADSDDEKSARVVVSMTCTESRFEYTGECFAVVKSRSENVVDELEKARNSWKFMINFQEENLDFGASLLAVMYYTYRCVIWARFTRALH
jgi:hypothetical protein